MAVKNKTEIMNAIKTLVGDDTSDASLELIGDLSDTFDDLEKKSQDTTDWKAKYEANDAEWRKKYKERFFSGESVKEEQEDGTNESDNKEEQQKTSFDELFEKE